MAGGLLEQFFRAGVTDPSATTWNGGLPVEAMAQQTGAPVTGAVPAMPEATTLFSRAPLGLPTEFMSFRPAAPAQQSAPVQAPAQPEGGSVWDSVNRSMSENRHMLAAMGAGLLKGGGKSAWGNAIESGLQYSQLDRLDRKEREAREEKEAKRRGALNLALQMGFDRQQAETLANDPETLNRLWLHRQTREPSEFERLTKGLDADQIEQARLHRLGIAPEKPRFEKIGEDEDTGKVLYGWVYPQSGKVVPYSDARNRATADQVITQGGGQPLLGSQGGNGAPPVDGIRPRPAGADPKVWRQEETKRLAKQGQEAELPAELAGRLALTDEYLKKAPSIGKFIQQGGLTGLWDANRGSSGYGEQGKVYRQIQSGVDGLRRALTGAGMPADEAREYADRYLPQMTDTADKLLSKHQQLTNELQRFSDLARQGRGGTPASPSRAPQRQTRSGVSWSVGGQ